MDGAPVSSVKAVLALLFCPGLGPRDRDLCRPGCVVAAPAAIARPQQSLEITLRRTRGRVDVVVVGAGLDTRAERQRHDSDVWIARLSGPNLPAGLKAPQQVLLEASDLLSVRLEPRQRWHRPRRESTVWEWLAEAGDQIQRPRPDREFFWVGRPGDSDHRSPGPASAGTGCRSRWQLHPCVPCHSAAPGGYGRRHDADQQPQLRSGQRSTGDPHPEQLLGEGCLDVAGATGGLRLCVCPGRGSIRRGCACDHGL